MPLNVAAAAQRPELTGAARRLQRVEAADAELFVKEADLLQTEPRNTQQLEDSRRELFAQLIEITRASAAHELFDDRCGGLADARRFLQIPRRNQLLGIAIESGECSCRFLERQRLESIRLAQLDVLRDLVERAGNLPLVHAAIILPCNRATGSSWPSTARRATRSSGSPTRCATRPAPSRSDCRLSSRTVLHS